MVVRALKARPIIVALPQTLDTCEIEPGIDRAYSAQILCGVVTQGSLPQRAKAPVGGPSALGWYRSCLQRFTKTDSTISHRFSTVYETDASICNYTRTRTGLDSHNIANVALPLRFRLLQQLDQAVLPHSGHGVGAVSACLIGDGDVDELRVGHARDHLLRDA